MLGHFGFSYVGLIYLLMLYIPNIIWAQRKPEGYDPSGENKLLLIFERVGQVLCTASVRSGRSSVERGGTDETPWWRTLKKDGELNEKYPEGIDGQKLRLEMEGHTVVQKGKRYFVKDYEQNLVAL